MFALAQAHHGGFVGGVDGEVESADAFDGHDVAGNEPVRWCRTGSVDGISFPSGETSQTRGPHTQQAFGCA